MVWVFIIIGLITSGSALFRIARSVSAGRGSWPWEAVVLLPLAASWATGHTTALGWIALLLAFGVELLLWAAGSGVTSARNVRLAPPPGKLAPKAPKSKPAPGGSLNERSAAQEDEAAPADAVPPPRIVFTTIALLQGPRDVAPEVFHASLRRVGQRDAELRAEADDGAAAGSSDQRVAVQAGVMILEVTAKVVPLSTAEVQAAAGQTWDWPQAAEVAVGHSAHVVLTSRSPVRTPRAEVVRLHWRAHAALAEFAPILAVLWRAAGKLTPVGAPAESAQTPNGPGEAAPDALAALGCCVSFRAYPAAGGADRYVSDTVGLHAFNLPDIQAVTEDPPDESVSGAIYELAYRFFTSGCDLREGQEWTCSRGGKWRASHRAARHAPPRNVLQLERCAAGDPPAAARAGGRQAEHRSED